MVHGLVPGETYVFRVQAVNVYGLSEESQESSPIAVEPALGENNTENHNTVSCLDRLEKLKEKKTSQNMNKNLNLFFGVIYCAGGGVEFGMYRITLFCFLFFLSLPSLGAVCVVHYHWH